METRKQTKNAFEGFETWYNAFKMKFKMHSRVFSILLLLVIVVWITNLCVTYNNNTHIALKWLTASVLCSVKSDAKLSLSYNGHKEQLTVWTISKTPWIKARAQNEISRVFFNLLKICSLLLFHPVVIMVFEKRASTQSGKQYIRGARFDERWEFAEKARKRKEKLDLPFGQIRQPVLAEPKHTFVIGKPGSGKTVCMNGILNRIQERGNKGIVYDYKGDYIQKFYRPGVDIIFNPLDKRSVGWNLFNDIKTRMDIDATGTSLIPDDPKEAPFWAIGARSVFAGILHNLYQENLKSNRHLWEAVIENAPQLVNRLSLTEGGQAGQKFIGNGETSQSLGILAKLMQHSLCFSYMANNDGDFSIIDWLYDETPGMIFISNYADLKDTLKPILALFIDTLGRKLLSMPDDIKRRRFFILDEFNTLQKLPTLLDLLTGSRSKGGCAYLGVQDYGKIDETYGQKLRQSIINACSNNVIFTLSDEAAKIASKGMDETQFMETNRTLNMGVETFRDGISLNERKDKELLMFPSEIEALPDMRGVVKFSNHNRVMSNWFNPDNPSIPKHIFPNRNEPFEMRQDLLLDNIIEEQQRVMAELEANTNLTMDFDPEDDLSFDDDEIEEIQIQEKG